MDIKEFYSYIDKHIQTYKRLFGKEICIRCPFCGDSKKHLNKGHFYIGEVDGVLLYNCMRAECNASGIVNKRLLDTLGITDLKLATEVKKMSMSYKNKIIRTTHNSSIKFVSYNFEYFKNFFPNKLQYLERRLYNKSEIDLNKYRIIFSPINFIDTYGLKLNKYQYNLLHTLEHDTVGFLNMNGSGITFRYISDNSEYRYYKMKLFDNTDIYSIKNTIDLLKLDKLNINIAEGAFDIINISNRLTNIVDNKKDIFLAANGKDYINKVEYMSKYLGIIDLQINIFRDRDMGLENIHKQFKNSIFKDSYSIYSNTLAKDYSEDQLFVLKDY